jgi:hypothetical protein
MEKCCLWKCGAVGAELKQNGEMVERVPSELVEG